MAEPAPAVDDTLFEFLHMEAVRLMMSSTPAGGEQQDSGVQKLESIGFRVGIALVERCSSDMFRFKDELDTMRFMCKEFWLATFLKQVDNLKTNHQGMYVLQDTNFRFLTHLSDGSQYLPAAESLIAFSCGVIRGALFNLGWVCTVEGNVPNFPMCQFLVTMQ